MNLVQFVQRQRDLPHPAHRQYLENNQRATWHRTTATTCYGKKKVTVTATVILPCETPKAQTRTSDGGIRHITNPPWPKESASTSSRNWTRSDNVFCTETETGEGPTYSQHGTWPQDATQARLAISALRTPLTEDLRTRAKRELVQE